MDKIFIRALKTEAIIGIFDWERQVKQTVLIDIEIAADVRKAALSDSIEDTLNYKRVAKRVLSFVEASQFHLVETLAEHPAAREIAAEECVEHSKAGAGGEQRCQEPSWNENTKIFSDLAINSENIGHRYSHY